MTEIKNFSPYRIVKKALGELKENEKKVILGRFGIDEDRKTLSYIGKELHLSRERIRQIEREALKKLAKKINESHSKYIDEIVEKFEKSGGISSHDKIAEKFLEKIYHEDKNEFNSLNLIFYLIPRIIKIEKTKELESSWMLSSLSKDEVVSIVNDWIKHLEKSKTPKKVEVLLKEHPRHQKYSITFLSELPYVSKKLVATESGLVGLSTWPEVNPKNVRDKIYYIFKKENKPLHFDEIAKKINEQNFSKKKVVRATVHNELISDKRFVLIGRGIYALSEWGYKQGTVLDIIKDILSEKGEMKACDIVDEVLKQRSVKKNTILINLQTKKDFVKTGKESYKLAKN